MTNDSTIDINIHATYIVVGNFQFAILISLILFSLGILYWLIFQIGLKLSKMLILIHLAITHVGSLLAIILTQFYGDELKSFLNIGMTLLILLVLLCQALLIVNILVGLINLGKQTSG